MNVEEKAKQQKVIQSVISGIDFQITEAVKKKDQLRTNLNTFLQHGTETYSQEYNQKQIEIAKESYLGGAKITFNKISASLEDLRKLINERDASLDLANPALTNALSLINTIGDLSYEQTVKINQNFAFDQSSLRVIQAAYQTHNTFSDGGISEMVYNTNETIDNLIKTAEGSFTLDGSINFFATQFAKFAKLEGVEVENTPDSQGVLEAMRKAAGL